MFNLLFLLLLFFPNNNSWWFYHIGTWKFIKSKQYCILGQQKLGNSLFQSLLYNEGPLRYEVRIWVTENKFCLNIEIFGRVLGSLQNGRESWVNRFQKTKTRAALGYHFTSTLLLRWPSSRDLSPMFFYLNFKFSGVNYQSEHNDVRQQFSLYSSSFYIKAKWWTQRGIFFFFFRLHFWQYEEDGYKTEISELVIFNDNNHLLGVC